MKLQLIKLFSGMEGEPEKPTRIEFISGHIIKSEKWKAATEQAERVLEIVKPVIKEAYLKACPNKDVWSESEIDMKVDHYLKSLDL